MQKLLKFKTMRKLLPFIMIFISLSVYSQEENPFAAADDNSTTSSSIKKDAGIADEELTQDPAQAPAGTEDPGNPGSELPIDDYLPLLMVTAIGMIGYAGYRKRKQTA